MNMPVNTKYNLYELVITSGCNLRCSYCFEDWQTEKSCSPTQKMDEGFIDDFIPFMLETKAEGEVDIIIFGGEPLTNWTFIEKFVARVKKLHFPIHLSIVTNGTLLNSEKIDFLVENFGTITFSIDGTDEGNVNRLLPNGKSSWELTISNLIETQAKAQRHNTHIAAIMVINKNNIDYLVEGYDLLSKKLFLNVDLLFDYSTKVDANYLSQIESYLSEMFIEKKMPLPNMIKNKILNERHTKNNNHYCFHPEVSITINSKGQLSFCHLVGPDVNNPESNSQVLGDIKQGIYNIEEFNAIVNRTKFSSWKTGKECETCDAAYWCKGGCIGSHRILTESNNYDIIDTNQCQIHKIINKVSQKLTGGN